jgi:peroxiredoxin
VKLPIVLLLTSLAMALPNEAQEKFHRDTDSKFIVNEGDLLPPFSFVTLSGDSLDSDFFANSVVVLQFVASWCPFSTSEMKAIERDIWQKYQATGNVQVYGFSVDDPSDTTTFRKFLAANNITYPFCYDCDERIYKLFSTPKGTVPRCVLVNEEGRIVQLSDEFYRKDYKRMRHLIRGMVKKMNKSSK